MVVHGRSPGGFALSMIALFLLTSCGASSGSRLTPDSELSLPNSTFAPQVGGNGDTLVPLAASNSAATRVSARLPQIFIAEQGDSDHGPAFTEFSAAASGNVAPLVRSARFVEITGATIGRNFWAYAKGSAGLFSSQGSLIRPYPQPSPWNQGSYYAGQDRQHNDYFVEGTPPFSADGCDFSGDVTLLEYQAGSDANQLVRTLDLGPKCFLAGITFDASGTLYIAQEYVAGIDGITSASILVYPPGASGSAAPMRTLGTPVEDDSASQGITELLTDFQGNLFMRCQEGFFEYPMGTGPRRRALRKNVYVSAFAFDARNSLYAVVLNPYVGEKAGIIYTTAIEVFAEGATTPNRTITGPKTFLGNWAQDPRASIAVVP
jgi:hypothetical protein